jgi:hypothetical protein
MACGSTVSQTYEVYHLVRQTTQQNIFESLLTTFVKNIIFEAAVTVAKGLSGEQERATIFAAHITVK